MCIYEFKDGITDRTYKILNLFFSENEKPIVINILKNQCGNNLPFCEKSTPKILERIRFATIKYSEGELGKFRDAVELANIDYRDLLVKAGFAENISTHDEWANNILKG